MYPKDIPSFVIPVTLTTLGYCIMGRLLLGAATVTFTITVKLDIMVHFNFNVKICFLATWLRELGRQLRARP